MYIIYNADGTVLGELSYIAKKVFGNGHCAACDITHSFTEMGEKSEFKQCKTRLAIEIKTIHRDELLPGMEIAVKSHGLPLVLKEDGPSNFTVILNAEELDMMKGSVTLFEESLTQKLL